MTTKRHAFLIVCALLLAAVFDLSPSSSASGPDWTGRAVTQTTNQSWFFAVSGDSRDCGDLIMPKIAQSIADHRMEAPVEFYWHLGDFRALYRVDCDMGLRLDAKFVCDPEKRARNEKIPAAYLDAAWNDFIEHQVLPFGTTTVFLGIGNHELINSKPGDVTGQFQIIPRDRSSFQRQFQWWLNSPILEAQRRLDLSRGISSCEFNTYYHFVKNGVDFIYLDNAGPKADFSDDQLKWLEQILKADAQDTKVRTIIAGMHAALPLSTKRGHAMDRTCEGFSSGNKAYKLLYDAQNLGDSADKRKNVYVFASHSHFFEQNIYDSTEHRAEHPEFQGRVLPGWIIGTAGAEQYIEKDAAGKDIRKIMYGYVQAEVRPDGTMTTLFRQVDEKSLPLGDAALTNFCFQQNKRVPSDDREDKPCNK